MQIPPSAYQMHNFTVYLNTSGESAYLPGHRLELAVSHWLEICSAPPAEEIAGLAAEIFNGEQLLDVIEEYRNDSELGEIKYLMACLYLLLGFRPMRPGDVVHVTSGHLVNGPAHSTWLAMGGHDWTVIEPPAHTSGIPLDAAAIVRYASRLGAAAQELRRNG